MRSISRVLAQHARELENEALVELPSGIRALDPIIALGNDVDVISRWVGIPSESGDTEWLELRRLTIYELAERYPGLDISW